MKRILFACMFSFMTHWSQSFGQCIEWQPAAGTSSLPFGCASLAVVDFDGAGPGPEMLFGTPITGGLPGVLRWNGLAWVSEVPGASLSSALYSVPAGVAGFATNTLVIGRSLDVNEVRRLISSWDGSTWAPLGPITPDSYSSLASVRRFGTWDPDGAGPLAPWLIVGGSFTRFGGVTTTNIAAWDGAQWHALGSGLPNFPVNAIAEFDPDGAGSLNPLLVVAHGSTVKTWNGSTWTTLGSTFNSSVSSLVAFDPDDDGPLSPQLFAHGSFSNYVVRWNGLQWESTQWTMSSPTAIKALDLDGAGPLPVRLHAAGTFTGGRLAEYVDGLWRLLPGGTAGPSGSQLLEVIDPDGEGPRVREVISGGGSQTSWDYRSPCPGVCSWDGARWRPLGDEFLDASGTPIVMNFHIHDDDGDGPAPASLYAAGSFTYVAGNFADSLARWDGSRWVGLGTPPANNSNYDRWIYQLATFDPDGAGPQAPWLVAGDNQTGASRWTGEVWQSIGYGSGTRTLSLNSFDPDGPGPEALRLVSSGDGGIRVSTGGNPWTYFGILDRSCRFDADGSGSGLERIVGLQYSGHSPLMIFDGTSLQPLGPSENYVSPTNSGAIIQVISLDLDGSGPRLPEVVIGSSDVFVNGVGTMYGAAATGNGLTWRQLGDFSAYDAVRGLSSIDPDGAGAESPQLILGASNGYTARLSNNVWLPIAMSSEFNHCARTSISFDADGQGPLPMDHWIGGGFTSIAGFPAVAAARFNFTIPPPGFIQHAAEQAVFEGATATFTVRPSPTQSLTYAWKLNGQPLQDGPTPTGSFVSGALTASLSKSNVSAEDEGMYSCMITGTCESATSTPVPLTVAPCNIDVNCDGAVNGFDIQATEEAVNGDFSNFCLPSADLNGDGSENGFDIETEEQRVNGAPC